MNEKDHEELARVEPSNPCVAPAGSSAEQPTSAVTSDERTDDDWQCEGCGKIPPRGLSYTTDDDVDLCFECYNAVPIVRVSDAPFSARRLYRPAVPSVARPQPADPLYICERCQMKLPERLMTFGIGVRSGKAAWCAACRTPEGESGAAKRAEVVAMRKARWAQPADQQQKEKHMKKVFKIDAQGDTIYIQAGTEPEALDILAEKMGDIPHSLLTVTVVDELPEGEEFL